MLLAEQDPSSTQQHGDKKNEVDPGVSAVSPHTTGLLPRFLQFLWACHTNVDASLEHTLQRSIELGHFTESIQSLCDFPRRRLYVRWALWELLHNAVLREKHVEEAEKQSRLYGGGWSKTTTRQASPCSLSLDQSGNGTTTPTTLGSSNGDSTSNSNNNNNNNNNDGTCSNSKTSAYYYQNSNKNGARGVADRLLRERSESEEDALLAAMRERGHYHGRLPRHEKGCSRCDIRNRDSNSNIHSGSSGLFNTFTVEPSNMDTVLGTVASLTSSCSLCIAEGLLQGCWMNIRLLQLIDTVAIAHLCAAPLIIPNDVLSITPREAMCVAYHVAQHQLQLSITLLSSIAIDSQPSSFSSLFSSSLPPPLSCLRGTSEDEKKHHAGVARAIAAVAQQGLEVCVYLLTALRSLRGENRVYVVLLHAATLTFCDRDGVTKAKQLMMNFATSLLDTAPAATTGENVGVVGDSATTSCTGKKADDNDLYNMWLNVESLEESGDGVGTGGGRTFPSLLRIEEVATGVLFAVYLELLQLRELPLPTTHHVLKRGASMNDSAAIEVASHVCFRAHDALDNIIQPRLLHLCDAADGAVCTRGRQLQSLYWLLRGTLCHVLNTLSLSTASLTVSHIYNMEEPSKCVSEAVKRSEVAREFLGHPLAPDWIKTMVQQENTIRGNTTVGTAADAVKGEEEHRHGIGQWRLELGVNSNDGHYCGNESTQECITLSPQERVTDMALLPLPVMRLWFVLARTVFRSVSADLVSVRAREDMNGPTTPIKNTAPPTSAAVPTPPPSTLAAAAAHESSNDNNSSRGRKGRKGAAAAAQQAAMAQRENQQKTEEAQHRTERSSLGFWYRWHEAIRTYCLMSRITRGRISLLGRFREAMCFTSGDKTAVMTPLMRVLSEVYPIAGSQQGAFAAAQLIDSDLLSSQQEEVGGEPSLALFDERLRNAWESYDLQCVQTLLTPGEASNDSSNNNNNNSDNKNNNKGITKPQSVTLIPRKHNKARPQTLPPPPPQGQNKTKTRRGVI